MHIDFLKDLENETKRLLKEFGFSVPTFEQLRQQDKRDETLKNENLHDDLKNLLLHFCTVNFRRVPIIKRTVYVSEKLKGNEKIREIIVKLENGEDVNDLLSHKVKKLNQAKNADLLISEWGIHHLHFRESRSNELLFIYFSDENAYLIEILEHENRSGSIVTWTNTDLIQILHDNWPHVIKPYILKIESDALVLNVEQRRALRRKYGNTSVIVSDGTEYQPLGGGYSPSKHPFSASMKSIELLRTAKELQVLVEANYEKIKETFHNHTTNPSIKLMLDEDLKFQIIESKTHVLIVK